MHLKLEEDLLADFFGISVVPGDLPGESENRRRELVEVGLHFDLGTGRASERGHAPTSNNRRSAGALPKSTNFEEMPCPVKAVPRTPWEASQMSAGNPRRSLQHRHSRARHSRKASGSHRGGDLESRANKLADVHASCSNTSGEGGPPLGSSLSFRLAALAFKGRNSSGRASSA